MDSNSKQFKNYSPEEVDHFLEQIIIQVEKMIEDDTGISIRYMVEATKF